MTKNYFVKSHPDTPRKVL